MVDICFFKPNASQAAERQIVGEGAGEHDAIDAAGAGAGDHINNHTQIHMCSDGFQDIEINGFGVMLPVGMRGRIGKGQRLAICN